MTTIYFEFDPGWSEYERALARMTIMLSDMRWFWPRLVPLFISWMREQFASEGRFMLGHEWEPLSEAYAARKMQQYPGRGILYATGQLRNRASRPRRIVTPTSITFVIDDFARREGATMDPEWFMGGTERMPPRPLWGEVLPPAPLAEVEALAVEEIDAMARKLGLV